jgi:hypothetical protein
MVLLLTVMFFLFLSAESFGQSIDKLDGYGGYKFGMTLEQAFAVRRDVKITQCEYENVYRCIERQGNFFGHAGTIVVQISGRTKRVNKIVLTFDRIDEKFGQGKCKAVLDDILPQLFKVYKPKDAKVRDGGAS